ncbi:MAG: hypothetical protein QOJ66_814 [Ilumatobacteraceae bacterium]|jgi:hypothetical protein
MSTTTKCCVGECVTPAHQGLDALQGNVHLDAIVILRRDVVVGPSCRRHPAQRSRIDSGQPALPPWERSRQDLGLSDWQPGPLAASSVRIAVSACRRRHYKSARPMPDVDEVQL